MQLLVISGLNFITRINLIEITVVINKLILSSALSIFTRAKLLHSFYASATYYFLSLKCFVFLNRSSHVQGRYHETYSQEIMWPRHIKGFHGARYAMKLFGGSKFLWSFEFLWATSFMWGSNFEVETNQDNDSQVLKLFFHCYCFLEDYSIKFSWWSCFQHRPWGFPGRGTLFIFNENGHSSFIFYKMN